MRGVFRWRRDEERVRLVPGDSPCQAYRPITRIYAYWPNVRCNRPFGYAGNHEHTTPDNVIWTWPRGLERGEVMS